MYKETLSRFGKQIGIGIAVGAAALTSCAKEAPSQINTPVISNTASSELLKTHWEGLPADARIGQLLRGDYKSFDGFDPQKEIIKATSEVFCENVECHYTPSELEYSVHFAPPDLFINKLQVELGKEFTPEEKELEMSTRLTLLTTNGQIFINQQFLDEEIDHISRNDPSIINKLGDKNLRAVYEMSLITQQEMLKNIKESDPLTFSGFSLKLPNNPNLIIFDTLNGFELEGKDLQGKKYYLNGGKIAIADEATRILIQERMGLPYLSGASEGSDLIRRLNDIAEIPNSDVLEKVVDGRFIDLLDAWGAKKRNPTQTRLQAAGLALAATSLVMQGAINSNDAQSYIEDILKIESTPIPKGPSV